MRRKDREVTDFMQIENIISRSPVAELVFMMMEKYILSH